MTAIRCFDTLSSSANISERMKGKFIVIEGLDGCGKSTQVRLLQQKLEADGTAHRFIHFPMLNQGVYGNLTAEFLRGEFGSLEEVHPKLVALLFANDRLEHIGIIREWLDKGYCVLADRYVYSNVAFQCAKLKAEEKKRELKDWILAYEFGHNALPRPDRTLFLDMPFSFIERSLTSEREGSDRDYLNGRKDIHESSLAFQRNVLEMYRKLLAEEKDFSAVSCTDEEGNLSSIDEIQLRIREILSL